MSKLRQQALQKAGLNHPSDISNRSGGEPEPHATSTLLSAAAQAEADAFAALLAELRVPEVRITRLLDRMLCSALGIPNAQHVARPCVELLKAQGVQAPALRRIVCDRPEVLHLDTATLKTKTEFLLALGVRRSALGEVLERCPALLEAPIFQIGSVTSHLKGMGIKELLLPFLLERFPSVFLQDPGHRLVPIVEWYNGLGIKSTEIAQMVEEWPQILIHPPDQLQPKVNALADAGMDSEGIAGAIRRIPAILALDLETQIMPTLEYLQEHGLIGVRLGKALASEPGILQLNLALKTEQRKVQYLTQVLGRSVAELHECPQYLTSRLTKIAPRAAFLRERQGKCLADVPLRQVVDLADREWAARVAGVPAAEFFQFKEAYMEEQAEEEYRTGEWDYFFRSSMP